MLLSVYSEISFCMHNDTKFILFLNLRQYYPELQDCRLAQTFFEGLYKLLIINKNISKKSQSGYLKQKIAPPTLHFKR